MLAQIVHRILRWWKEGGREGRESVKKGGREKGWQEGGEGREGKEGGEGGRQGGLKTLLLQTSNVLLPCRYRSVPLSPIAYPQLVGMDCEATSQS